MLELKRVRRRLAVAFLGLLMATPLMFAQRTFAISSSTCGPILSGLWSGVNLTLNTQHNCQGSSVAGNASSKGAPQAGVMNGKYVALGDSVAAGLGLTPVSDSTNDPACGVSDEAYPSLVAENLHMPYQNIACSGATVGDLVTDQDLSGANAEIAPQLNTAFANGTPSLITITAGANDVYWNTFLSQCYVGTCGGGTDQVVFSGLQTLLSAKLAYALSDISSRSGGNPPPVIVTGYYQAVSPSCSQLDPNLSSSEISWIRTQTDALNQTLAGVAANYPFVHFAPLDFGGHELCTSDPWVQGVSDPAPFHPTAHGQQAIANAVLAHMQ